MPNTRSFLLIALLLTGFFLWEAWQRDYSGVPAVAETAVPTDDTPVAARSDASAPVDVPPASAAPSDGLPAVAAAPTVEATSSAAADLISVESDVLRLRIDPRGGNVVGAELLAYPIAPKDPATVVHLLDNTDSNYFVAQSGFVGNAGAAPDHRSEYHSASKQYRLAADAATVEVPLVWEDPSGVRVTKTIRLTRGSYAVDVSNRIDNQSASAWSASEYRQLQRNSPLVDRKFSFTNPEQYSFVGASWFSPDQGYEKLAFDKFEKEPLNRSTSGGWVAQQQHYFFAAWIPVAAENAQFTTQVVSNAAPPRYLIRAMAPSVTVAPGASANTSVRLYVGPKLQDHLEDVAPGLAFAVDYGKVTFIAQPLFVALKFLHSLTGNWGWSIILITILIKLVFFKLTEAQYRSFAKMRKLTPRMAALKERYGDDKQKLNQATMELYQKEKINPLGGCLPILVQIPVFIALYWVLLESVELRQAPFMLWITNLSDRDPYFILPVLNGLAMFATQKLTPTAGMDPMQARVMQMMPVVFSIMFAFFPAGLVLYWTINGVLGLAQQYIITKRIEAGEKA
jgi:YidC/Oxa1 family membrane protein insertase